MIKSYEELCSFVTFKERLDYLKFDGIVGRATFGFDRYLNQNFYHSREWQQIRKEVILRDNCCDLAIKGREIFFRPVIHHINPITIEDVEKSNSCIFDLNNLICTIHETHNAIHYGSDNFLLLDHLPKERFDGDMCPWLIDI